MRLTQPIRWGSDWRVSLEWAVVKTYPISRVMFLRQDSGHLYAPERKSLTEAAG